MKLRRPSKRTVLISACLIALVAGGSLLLRSAEPPESLKKLEAASRAGADAQAETRRIIANLEDIASNLEAGENLTEQSSSIHDLTERQARSLRDLIVVLKDQLRALERTRATLGQTEEAATGVAELGARQKAVIQRSVAALRTLQGYIEDATRKSARFAQAARYGARLAEDTREHFRP
jgi:hypothetical protein